MSNDQIVSFEKIEPQHFKKAISTAYLIFCNSVMGLIGLIAPLGGFLCILLLSRGVDFGTMQITCRLFAYSGLALAIITIPSMIYLGFAFLTFIEWPFNQILARRMRNQIALRSKRLVEPNDEQARVVELVPRENWQEMKLETATDIVLFKIVDDMILMEGDCFRYKIPAASIASCKLEQMKPPGWFVHHYFFTLILRTQKGFQECPLSLRDYKFGQLSPAKRLKQSLEVVKTIDAMASQYYQENFEHASSLPVVQVEPTPSDNPYAAPMRAEH